MPEHYPGNRMNGDFSSRPRVAIVDYGMGNLFSVARACTASGLDSVITAEPQEVYRASGIILPGVGAFGDAMATLRARRLVSAMKEQVASGTPFFGICLGMQLLMTDSEEFGLHQGLNIIEGSVIRFGSRAVMGSRVKVPQVGWNRIWHADAGIVASPILAGVPDGAFMYFVHSYYAVPERPRVVRSLTQYAGTTYCSSLEDGHVFACQFHPEKSGAVGLRMYENFREVILKRGTRV